MEQPRGHTWSPIEELPVDWIALARPDLSAYVAVWLEDENKLKDKALYSDFLDRLRRECAIETGVIERLYTLSEGATKSLIERGLDAALLFREDSDQPPEHVIELIRDQLGAIEGLYQFVTGERELTPSYVKELHQAITAHQNECEGIDTLGNRVKRQLLRGAWKQWPNHVRFADGSLFEFCPPEQVDSEMDRLLKLYSSYATQGVAPEVLAAWLHHRFTLIHPFQDGNGRVVRCLATLVFIKARWLPLLVTRHDRPDYLNAIRKADSGDLSAMVGLFDVLQRRAIRRALELSEELSEQTKSIKDALESAKSKLVERNREIEAQYKAHIGIGLLLHRELKREVEKLKHTIATILKEQNADYSAQVADREPPHVEARDWHWHAISQCAKLLGYYANRNNHASWVSIRIQTHSLTEILFAFHGAGWSKGIIACSAMAYQRLPEHDLSVSRRTQIGDLEPLCTQPFEFTYREHAGEVQKRFAPWVVACLENGVKYWAKYLNR